MSTLSRPSVLLRLFFRGRSLLYAYSRSHVPDALGVVAMFVSLTLALLFASGAPVGWWLLSSLGGAAAVFSPLALLPAADALAPHMPSLAASLRRIRPERIAMSDLASAVVLLRSAGAPSVRRGPAAYSLRLGFVAAEADLEFSLLVAERALHLAASSGLSGVLDLVDAVPSSHAEAVAAVDLTVQDVQDAVSVMGPSVALAVLQHLLPVWSRGRTRAGSGSPDGEVARRLVAFSRLFDGLSPLQVETVLRLLPVWSGPPEAAVAAARALVRGAAPAGSWRCVPEAGTPRASAPERPGSPPRPFGRDGD